MGHLIKLEMFKVKVKAVGGTDVVDSTHKIVIKVVLMDGVAKRNPQQT
jgi:hypothetical protein